MSEPIKPALTETEWQQLLRQLPLTATVDRATCADLSDMATDQNGQGSRHALAAVALYGQPFGFTPYDVTLLRYAAEYAKPAHTELNGLADRIAALLPERK